MLPSDPSKCDSCRPANSKRSLHLQQPITSSAILSSAPLVLTYTLVFYIAWRNLFPLLSGQTSHRDGAAPRRPSLRLTSIISSIQAWTYYLLDRTAVIAFSSTIALSAVLAVLIFCEISDILDPIARSWALEITISILLASLVLITPALEIHSITTASGWKFSGLKRGSMIITAALDSIMLLGWLSVFWWLGNAVASSPIEELLSGRSQHTVSEASLERIGVIGITLMASLTGFAAVSSLWQTFGVKVRKVTESDLARKQHGLGATSDLLAAKQSKLRALEMKMGEEPKQGMMGRLIGSIRKDPDTREADLLRMEISGLETMKMTLSNSLRLLKTRRDAQQQASTAVGRMCLSASYIFSVYCLYRIGATMVATLRRWRNPEASFATTDPINNVLALVAKHWDPSLDRAAWSRQISFLLSGLMLLASFNAVLQTVLLFSRFTPTRILHSAQQNLALMVSQISATYVVSTALLLRSNLPKEMGSVIEGALGAPLDTSFVERWFEGWFLGSCFLTALGIFVGRSFVGSADWDDDGYGEGDVELGKRS